MQRVLIVCHDINRCDIVIQKGLEIAQKRYAGVTLLFINETRLFDFFSKDEPFDKGAVLKQLKQKFEMLRRDDIAVLVEEGDSVDIVLRELEKEGSLLIVTDFLEDITVEVIEKVLLPVLVVKKGKEKYEKALLATEIAKPKECLELSLEFSKNIVLYMDSLVVTTSEVSVPMLDLSGASLDEQMYQEILTQKKEQFSAFCQEHSLECHFDSFNESLNRNIVAFAMQNMADLLVLSVVDSLSIMGSVVGKIVQSAPVDVLVCAKAEPL